MDNTDVKVNSAFGTWWVARDKNNDLWVFERKPSRQENYWWDRDYDRLPLDKYEFPELTWEDEPIQVELFIRKLL